MQMASSIAKAKVQNLETWMLHYGNKRRYYKDYWRSPLSKIHTYNQGNAW